MEQAHGYWKRRWGSERSLALVWLPLVMDAGAIVSTYSRFPPEEFYHFSQSGFAGALGRALVFSNFPVALMAIATIGVSVLALRGSPVTESERDRRIVTVAALAGTALCLVIAFPGVVDAGDLDARPVNIVPFVGVMLAIALNVQAIRLRTWPVGHGQAWRDQLSVAIVALLAIVSLPWIVADLGFYIDDIPIISRLFIASDVPDGETLAAVHLGHHHGLDGFLLVTTALVLNHLTRNRYSGRLATVLSVYLALMFTYGAFNLANDAWLEQVVKQGWAEWEIPSVFTPGLSVAWGAIILCTVIVWFVLFRSGVREPVADLATPSRALHLKAK
jgi:hypothetical protein